MRFWIKTLFGIATVITIALVYYLKTKESFIIYFAIICIIIETPIFYLLDKKINNQIQFSVCFLNAVFCIDLKHSENGSNRWKNQDR